MSAPVDNTHARLSRAGLKIDLSALEPTLTNDTNPSTAIASPDVATPDSASNELPVYLPPSRQSWASIDRAHAENDIAIYKALDRMRRNTIETTREPGVPVKLNLHIKIMINSQPLFTIDKDTKHDAVLPRKFALEPLKYDKYDKMAKFVQGRCQEMWSLAKKTVDQDCDVAAVDKALVDKDGKWIGKDLDFGCRWVALKLEEDGSMAEMTTGRTSIAGDDSMWSKEQQYSSWFWRNIEKGCLGQYMVEYTVNIKV